MFAAAEALDFERAAKLRDQLKKVRGELGEDGPHSAPVSSAPQVRGGMKAGKAAANRAPARRGARAARGRSR
jgi:excinuclease UvrABC nuclease subunit